MIPKRIHQTWFSADYTLDDGTPESWKNLNPDWDYRLWVDADLDDFVRTEFPGYLELYQSYPNVVQRTDLGRYMLLYRFGGIYADMDTDCLAPLDPLADEDRVILCEEPRLHWPLARQLGLKRFIFNGTMASPAGHPFWKHVLDCAHRCRHAAAKDVLNSTGPLMLSGAVQSWPSASDLSLNSCHLFAPLDRNGISADDEIAGDHAALRLSRHNWAGSWFSNRRESRFSRLKGKFRKWRVEASAPQKLTFDCAVASIDREMLTTPVRPFAADDPPNVVIFTPVRDAAPFLERHFELLKALDYPRDRLRIVYCEGDSTDTSLQVLEKFRDTHTGRFRGIDIINCPTGNAIARKDRWKPQLQITRRAAIAKVRNRLIQQGLSDKDDWVLWLDADVCDFPYDILTTLLARQEKIVTPDCVLEPGGPSYDLNAFVEIGQPSKSSYYKNVVAGLFQPPTDYWHRQHLHDFRYLDEVPLSSVGATMLLVHASVHRAGLTFAELPYKRLIETEAFGMLAKDLGLQPIGLPNVEIRHVKS